MSKKLAAFDYTQQILLVLSGTRDAVSITLFATAIGTPVGIASVCTNLVFSFINGVVKKIQNK